jgi:hypothetical protein
MNLQEHIKGDNRSSPRSFLCTEHLRTHQIWKGVILRLRRGGYSVIGFANPLLGVAVDTAYLLACWRGSKAK